MDQAKFARTGIKIEQTVTKIWVSHWAGDDCIHITISCMYSLLFSDLKLFRMKSSGRSTESPHPGVSHTYDCRHTTHSCRHITHKLVTDYVRMCRLFTQCVTVPIWGVCLCWYTLYLRENILLFSAQYMCHKSALYIWNA